MIPITPNRLHQLPLIRSGLNARRASLADEPKRVDLLAERVQEGLALHIHLFREVWRGRRQVLASRVAPPA